MYIRDYKGCFKKYLSYLGGCTFHSTTNCEKDSLLETNIFCAKAIKSCADWFVSKHPLITYLLNILKLAISVIFSF